MFESKSGLLSPPEVIARFDEMFERHYPSKTPESSALRVGQTGAAGAPADAAPEPGYVASAALAAFVRCRDLTCRWPGCDRPAHDCDLDHTIPYANGGPTHASNLKCYCRTHHQTITF
jgi:hypothetical protein